MSAFVGALIAHGIIGGLDVLINHELIGKLPARPGAAMEQRFHSARECLFGAIFLSLGWYEWHGAWVMAIVALFAMEILISTFDTVLELDIRSLPVSERVFHVALFINMGIILGLLVPVLLTWAHLPTDLVPADHGWMSWALSALALVAFGWSIRDWLAQRSPVTVM